MVFEFILGLFWYSSADFGFSSFSLHFFLSPPLPGPNQSPHYLCLHTEHSSHPQSIMQLITQTPHRPTPLPTQIPTDLATECLVIHSCHKQMDGWVPDHSENMLNVRKMSEILFGILFNFSNFQLMLFSTLSWTTSPQLGISLKWPLL